MGHILFLNTFVFHNPFPPFLLIQVPICFDLHFRDFLWCALFADAPLSQTQDWHNEKRSKSLLYHMGLFLLKMDANIVW